MTDTPPPIRTGVIGGPLWRTLPVGRDGGSKTIESVCPDNLVLKGIEGDRKRLPAFDEAEVRRSEKNRRGNSVAAGTYCRRFSYHLCSLGAGDVSQLSD
jgi:hypothetical protein